jgi:hypothetical protein
MAFALATTVPSLAVQPPGQPFSWWQALVDSTSPGYLAILILSLFGVIACGLTLWGAGRAQAQRRTETLNTDQAGVATMEFCIVLPILLFMILLLAQVTLAMSGNIYVHYSAYIATRAAIVYIPQDDGSASGGANFISNGTATPKLEAIRLAAVYALVPVSGRLENGALQADQYKNGISGYYEGYGDGVPNWNKVYSPISPKATSFSISSTEARLNYSEANTDIYVMETIVNPDETVEFRRLTGTYEFGPKDSVTVQVEHRLYLPVPYVRFLFSDASINQSEYDTRYNAKAKSFGYDHNDEARRYRTITAQYTLTNEGIYDELPDAPRIPRLPPSQRQENPLGLPNQ